ncbi:endo-beta-N-acetylglucosaminidase [Burkholderia ubonensis]|uniref:endo-beta-N-acetylglucosaminidase n=1 Tax=Burkholderia ubonensis TaxID=101571 RepID=UPI0009B49394|nr:hypothetical protein [Burkholderia ubonensis]
MKIFKKYVRFFLGSCIVAVAHASFANSPSPSKTFTWALDNSRNSGRYISIYDVDPNNLSGYLTPSSTKLNKNLTRQWLGSTQSGAGKDFTLIYRTRPSTPIYPDHPVSGFNPVTFENWAFIRKFINFGGDALSGSHISAPDPEWVDAAHRNGVKIYGTVYIDSSNGTLQMATNLLGSYNGRGEIYKENYFVPVLDKLGVLAKKLNLDGWFLNIENGLTADNVNQLRRITGNLFPIYLQDGIEFIAYTGAANQGISSNHLITDDDIANFDIRSGTKNYDLDNATGINPEIVRSIDYPVNSRKTYLMFLDGVFWRNIYQGQFWPMRVAAAKSTQCQFFKGAGNWPGFSQYAQAVYPATTSIADALCGGNPTSLANPIPTVILKIILPPFYSVTPKSTGVPCRSKCFYEYTQTSDNRDTLTFSQPFTRIKTTYGNYRAGSYDSESLYLQSVPGIKFWNKTRAGEPIELVWNYKMNYGFNGKPYTIVNPPSGGYCGYTDAYRCVLPKFFFGEEVGHYMNNQNTSIPYLTYLPGYQHDVGSPGNPSHNNWGNFPRLNYVMTVLPR